MGRGKGKGACRVRHSVSGRLRARGKWEKLGLVSPRSWRKMVMFEMLGGEKEGVDGWSMGLREGGKSEGLGRQAGIFYGNFLGPDQAGDEHCE
jgi:hypothetical protein